MTPDDPLSTPDWFPMSLDHECRTLTFVHMTRDTFRQSTFHHEAIIRPDDRTLEAPIDELAGLKPGVPNHFILHTAFCGSTLLARYLDDLLRCFVVKEPNLLTQLGGVPYSDSWPGWFATSLNLLGRAYPSDAATIIKLHDVCNWMGGLILDHDPQTRVVFLYNPLRMHLLQFLKDQRRRTHVHRHVRSLPMALLPALAKVTAGELTDAQCAAAMWLFNAHLCSCLLARPDADRVLLMNGRDVMFDPQTAVLTVGEHFGLADDDTRAKLAKLRPATSHAKDPAVDYDRAALAVDLAAAEHRYSEEVDAGTAWARELCPELMGVIGCA
jgi:hypothetical protein